MNECETEDCEQDSIDESLTRMLDRFGWETRSEGEKVMTADKTVLTTETEDGEIRVTGDVSPDETVMITLPDGLADADVVVNGESATPTGVNGNIEVIVEDGEVTIVIETKQADHEIDLNGSETDTEVSTSTSSESSTSRSGSSTIVSTSTSTSNSVSSNSA